MPLRFSSNSLVIVSGIPRSGTSLMMQMLEAGGMVVCTDGLRTADSDNPRGYFELERVKQLSKDATWLRSLEGGAVKIISSLLFHLPEDLEGRVIFMERPIGQILASQARMLERSGIETCPQKDVALGRALLDQVASVREEVARSNRLSLLDVSYPELISQPIVVAKVVADFLNEPLDTTSMAACVRPELYRHRTVD